MGGVQASDFNTIFPCSMGYSSTLFHVQNRPGAAVGMASSTGILAGIQAFAGDLEAYRIAMIGAVGFLMAALGMAVPAATSVVPAAKSKVSVLESKG